MRKKKHYSAVEPSASDASTDIEEGLDFTAPSDGFRQTKNIVADAIEETPKVEQRLGLIPAVSDDKNSNDDKPRPRVVYLPKPGEVPPKTAEVQLLRKNDKIEIPDDFDSDNEEGERNRIGNVPLWWYDKHKHVGYDLNAKKIARKFGYSEIDDLLKNADDPEAWRTVVDYKNQTIYKLTDADLELIEKLRKGKYPNASFDPEDSYVEFDNPDAAIYSHISTLRPKTRFLPSKEDEKRINRIIRLIRAGVVARTNKRNKQDKETPDVWEASIFVNNDIESSNIVLAPKLPPPPHEASYNPPSGLLWDEKRKQEFLRWAPEDDELGFIPHKYDCLRHVPAYVRNIHERYQRMLDLYLCPRSIRMKDNIDPESLLPILPKPSELKPFPEKLRLEYHSTAISAAMSLSFDSRGQYLAVGRYDASVEVFDYRTTRSIFTWKAPDIAPVTSVKFNPRFPILAISAAQSTFLLVLKLPGWGKPEECANDDEALPQWWDIDGALSAIGLTEEEEEVIERETSKTIWIPIKASGIIAGGWELREKCSVTSFTWHPKGLYGCSVCSRATSPSYQCAIHALSKQRTLRPFKRTVAGKIQAAAFHPSSAQLFVQYYNSLRCYSLQATETSPAGRLLKKFKGMDHGKGVAIHPSGEHIVSGGGDCKVHWFDGGIGEAPYQTLRYHKSGISSLGFHKTYPLLMSGGGDGVIHVTYAKVYYDLLTNPSIIPVKQLNPRHDFQTDNTSNPVMEAVWHPYDPVLAVAMKSGHVGCYT